MQKEGDINNLKTSWTKYACVQMIDIIASNELHLYLSKAKNFDLPVLKSYLGIDDLTDNIPYYWFEIQNYPDQKRLFTLVAGIFTHHDNIKWFAEKYSTKNMVGEFFIESGGKHKTNLRSALVVSGAAENSYRKKNLVPYDLSLLFSNGKVGLLFKDLLEERLRRVKYSLDFLIDNFFEICIKLNFHKALSLKEDQFISWLNGNSIYQTKVFDYDLKSLLNHNKLSALKVHQWLDSWDVVDFSLPMRSKPDPYYFIFKIDVRLLKHLSEVHRRKANIRRSEDINVQRNLDEKRTSEIKRFVEGGFPWSTLSENNRESEQYQNLKMPGFLPGAIVANILGPNSQRGKEVIDDNDLINITHIDENIANLELPDSALSQNWSPGLKPLEIIDGQHRLMAFDETTEIGGKFEVPVVAFYNLDRAWQAYLFYVINIKPKKINTSLGYDLYPLLRTQDWLENSKDGLIVYRESRAQELVEALWFYEGSPWHNRINMLGDNNRNNLNQATFIRALTSSYLKKTSKQGVSGLFADVLINKNNEEIRWVRAQQAAFLILLWEQVAIKASESEFEWAKSLNKEQQQILLFDSNNKEDSSVKINDAFLSKNSMLSKDQGVTGISMFSNDFFFVAANYFDEYDFNGIEWEGEIDERELSEHSIDLAIEQFRVSSLYPLISNFCNELMKFDWRMSSAEFTNPVDKEIQRKFKGSGGYKDIWDGLLSIFLSSESVEHRDIAGKLREIALK